MNARTLRTQAHAERSRDIALACSDKARLRRVQLAVRAGFEPARQMRSWHVRFQNGALGPLEAPHRGNSACRRVLADEEGFEPPDPSGSAAFETAAIGRSATHPGPFGAMTEAMSPAQPCRLRDIRTIKARPGFATRHDLRLTRRHLVPLVACSLEQLA